MCDDEEDYDLVFTAGFALVEAELRPCVRGELILTDGLMLMLMLAVVSMVLTPG